MLLLCFPVGILESAEMELTLNTESLASVSVFSLSVVLVVLVIVVVCSVGCIIWWQRWDKNNSSGSGNLRAGAACVALPEFSGTNILVGEWVRRVRAVKDANQWDDTVAVRMLPTSLSGPALGAYCSLEDAQKMSFDDVVKSVAYACIMRPSQNYGPTGNTFGMC